MFPGLNTLIAELFKVDLAIKIKTKINKTAKKNSALKAEIIRMVGNTKCHIFKLSFIFFCKRFI